MASKVLLRRKKEDKKISKKLVGTIEQENLDKCPVFKVRYLGKTPAQGEYGREFIQEPVETLLKLKDRTPKLPKSVLQITERGFHFLDVNGTFGKGKHVLIPIYHVCYGVADQQNPHVFAIITRTDSNPENSLLECHAFLCDRQKVAAQITYWLLRTFLHVFEDLQRRRRVRQERKIRRLQETALDPAANAARQQHAAGYTDEDQGYTDVALSSPTDSIGPDIYSVTLEGSKDNGTVTAVGLTKTRPHSFIESGPRNNPTTPASLSASGGKKFATVPSRYSSQEQPAGSGARVRQPVQQMHNSHESLVNRHPSLKVSVSAGALPGTESSPTKKVSVGSGPPVVPRWPRNSDTTTPQSFIESRGGSQEYREDPRGKPPPPPPKKPPPPPPPKKPPPPLHHQQQEIVQQLERNRYIKNANAGVSPAKTPQGSRNGGGRKGNRSLSSSSRMSLSSGQNSVNSSQTTAQSDFVFIEMLQEEFSGLDVESSDTASTVRRAAASYNTKNRSVSSGETGAAALPLDQKLSGEDIQKRIREWLKRTSPDAESVAFDDNILDRISLAGTLGHHDSRRVPTPPYAPSVRSSVQSPIRNLKSVAGTFNHMPSDREYF